MNPLLEVVTSVKKCALCLPHLPLGVRPIVQVSESASIVIIGQAPSKKVHDSGVPWDDKSGDNLRQWLGVNAEVFYDATTIALMPMGFCYPGRSKSGDNPPRKECAPAWHEQILACLPQVKLTLLIGAYAQNYYLSGKAQDTLTETVKNYMSYLPEHFVLPHPSPRNNIWQAKNPWFAEEVIPALQQRVRAVLNAR